MNARTRRARRLLRTARRGPWGKGRNALRNAMQPVYGENREIHHYQLVTDPWYTRRDSWYRPSAGMSLRTKAGQRWLKEIEQAASYEMEHALSDCCG